jgi:hypothetical protein
MRRDLTERYRERLHGVVSCYDRIVVRGTLPEACYAEGISVKSPAMRPPVQDSAVAAKSPAAR